MGRSNDTTGIADNISHDSRMAGKQIICSYPCMDSTCAHHPVAAPIDGTICGYKDLHNTEGCKRGQTD